MAIPKAAKDKFAKFKKGAAAAKDTAPDPEPEVPEEEEEETAPEETPPPPASAKRSKKGAGPVSIDVAGVTITGAKADVLNAIGAILGDG